MKRRRVLIIGFGITTVLVGIAMFSAWQLWRIVHGPPRLPGHVQAIPQAMTSPPPIHEGHADWLRWRGPNGDGRSPVTGILTDWTGGLAKLWEVNFLCQGTRTAAWSAPVVQGNRLIVPGRDRTSDLVFCLDSQSGELIWSNSYRARTGTSHGPGPRATPVIDDDRVYTFGRGGDLTCWQLLDGALLWRRNVHDVGGQEPRWGHSASPLVHEDKVFVQGGGRTLVIAYNKMTGDVVWTSMEGTAGYAALALMEMDGTVGLLVFHGTGLACLDPSDGTVRWTVSWETNYDVNATTPAVADGIVFITSGYRVGGQAIQVEKDRAKPLWRNRTIASHHSDPIIIDGFLYGYSGQSNQNAGHFKCVELRSGREQWSTNEIGWGTTTYVDGHLLCMDIEGNLFLVKPDPNAFRLVAQLKDALGEVTQPAWTIPVVANGKVYLRYMQRLVCYDLMP